MKHPRIPSTIAFSVALATGWLLATSISAVAMAPSVGRGTSGGRAEFATSDTASLSITVRTCPVGYDPAQEGADYLRDCREPAGDTLIAVNQGARNGPSASTGTSGDSPQESTVTFSGLTAGKYTLAAKAPAEIGSAFIGGCASNARSFEDYPIVPFARVVDGSVTLELRAGEVFTCDWYQVLN